MKPPEQVRLELVKQWLSKANEDLSVAEYLLTGGPPFPNAAAFHAQQAAEKFTKAVLVRLAVEFPKTHDLEQLVDLVASVNGPLSEALRPAASLNPYSVEVRYPSESPALTQEEAKAATSLATGVRDNVLEFLAEYLAPKNNGEKSG